MVLSCAVTYLLRITRVTLIDGRGAEIGVRSRAGRDSRVAGSQNGETGFLITTPEAHIDQAVLESRVRVVIVTVRVVGRGQP